MSFTGNAPTIDSRHFEQGRKLCEKLMETVFTKDDPRIALVALMMCLPMTTKACGLRVWDTFEAMRKMERTVGEWDDKFDAAKNDQRSLIVLPR